MQGAGALEAMGFDYFNSKFASATLAFKEQIGIKQFTSLWAMGEKNPLKSLREWHV